MTCIPRLLYGGVCWWMAWRSTATIWFRAWRRMPPGSTKSCGSLLASRTGAWASFLLAQMHAICPRQSVSIGGRGMLLSCPPHVEMLRALLAHLSRSLGVMYHLRDSQLQMAASLAALDRLPGGVVLLDEAGHASFINRSARALFNKGDVVVQAAGHGVGQLRLAPALRAQEPAFQSLMRRSLEPQSSTGQYFSDALVICHANGESACVIHAAPLGSAQSFGTTDGS